MASDALNMKLEYNNELVFHVEEAIDHLKHVPECKTCMDELADYLIVLKFVGEKLQARIAEENEKELAEELREYWRSVF